MPTYQTIYKDSIDWHRLVTTARARELGLALNALALLAHRGRLDHVGCGLYRLAVPLPFAGEAPAYALAVGQIGPNAVLWGESVLALLGLLPSNPARIHVAVPGRVRRRVPDSIALHTFPANATATEYEGVPSQPVAAPFSPAGAKSCPNDSSPPRNKPADAVS